jgi:hypothetical protein
MSATCTPHVVHSDFKSRYRFTWCSLATLFVRSHPLAAQATQYTTTVRCTLFTQAQSHALRTPFIQLREGAARAHNALVAVVRLKCHLRRLLRSFSLLASLSLSLFASLLDLRARRQDSEYLHVAQCPVGQGDSWKHRWCPQHVVVAT